MKTLISESVAQLYFYYFVLIHIDFPNSNLLSCRDYLLLLTTFLRLVYRIRGSSEAFLAKMLGSQTYNSVEPCENAPVRFRDSWCECKPVGMLRVCQLTDLLCRCHRSTCPAGSVFKQHWLGTVRESHLRNSFTKVSFTCYKH